MDYRKYLADFDEAGDAVLDDWRWLIGNLQLWRVTKAGDALLRDPQDGSILLLSTTWGEIVLLAASEAEFESAVQAVENRRQWLMSEIVDGQAIQGMSPGPNECLSYIHPPALGGKITPDNLETCSILVHFSILGQTHEQTTDLAPGAKISRVVVVSPPAERPWWKFL